jgi:hypothetical protein
LGEKDAAAECLKPKNFNGGDKALIQVFAINPSTVFRLRGTVEDYLQTGDRCVGIG